MWEINTELFILIAISLILLWIIGRLLMTNNECIPIGWQRHSWAHIKNLNRSCFCSICEILIPPSSGLYCDCCGVCTHLDCLKRADRKFHCKNVATNKINGFKHQWVKGNLPLNADCNYCSDDIDYNVRPGLNGYRCCWCQRCAHKKCYSKLESDENCDFGEFYDMIVPPQSIVSARTRSLKLHLDKIKPPAIDVEWKPIIVMANTKSGSSTASQILSRFRGILNPLQVMELSSNGPKDALQWAIKLSPNTCRVVVAGGDGTVDWVLNTIKDLKIDPIPEVAIIPLGTGNDLSRVMGWGAEPPTEFDPVQYLRRIKSSTLVSLDRWLLKIINPRNRFSIKRNKEKTYYFYNYFSVGVDALVTLNFHKARESSFYILSSRILNKILYLCFGTHQVMQQDCAGLEQEIRVYIDDQLIDLPEVQSVVCLNIDSWGGGVKLWEMSQSPSDLRLHSSSDGRLEILGVLSSFHIAQMQVGLNKPIRLGQAKKIDILLNQPFPVQVDGEPWIQNPCKITIEKTDAAKMIRCTN